MLKELTGLVICVSLLSACTQRDIPAPRQLQNLVSVTGALDEVIPDSVPVSNPTAGDLSPRVSPARINMPAVRGEWGSAVTWDGRVLVTSSTAVGEWSIQVFRPEAAPKDTNGRPLFTDPVFSAPAHFKTTTGATPAGAASNLAIVPVTTYNQNPFPSDQNGARVETVSLTAAKYLTYETFLISDLDYAQGGVTYQLALGTRRARVIIEDPYTTSARVKSATILNDWMPLKTTAGIPIQGIEPTVTADGRLLAFHGTYHDLPPRLVNGVMTKPIGLGTVMYSYNLTANSATNWQPPLALNRLYENRNNPIAGTTLERLYPLARKPLRLPSGEFLPTSADATPNFLPGAYPWLFPDGDGIMFSTVIEYTTGPLRNGIAVVGAFTHWLIRRIDGQPNYNRYGKVFADGYPSVNLLFAPAGMFGGRWEPYSETSGHPFPYLNTTFSIPVFAGMSRSYSEVDMADGLGHYIAYFRMNEAIKRQSANADTFFEVDPSHTPDTSGNFHCGQLINAVFPQEYVHNGKDLYLGDSDKQILPAQGTAVVLNCQAGHPCYPGRDETIGISGQGIYFPPSGRIEALYTVAFDRLATGFTASLFMKRLSPLAQDHTLMRIDGRFALSVTANGRPKAEVNRAGNVLSATADLTLPFNQWVHLSFSYNSSGTIKLYVDGQLVKIVTGVSGGVTSNSQNLIIGPKLNGNASTVAAYILDEATLSDVVRSGEEISMAAFKPRKSNAGTAPPLAALVRLPLGLKGKEVVAPPTAAFSKAIVRLGKDLFNDPILSADKTISCATCHQIQKGFSDGRVTPIGITGESLQRNSPTLINRIMGKAFLGEAKPLSLERQSLIPIDHPKEMNLGALEAVNRLKVDAIYKAKFLAAFQQEPSLETMAVAIASYERTILSGDSQADRFAAGDSSALSPQAKRGRDLFFGQAFCFRCHSGSNFTDDSPHALGLLAENPADLGRFNFTQRIRDRNAFKTPSLRNIALTAPYFHDGSAATLRDVVNRYNDGPRAEMCPAEIDPRILPLGLTEAQKSDLVSFLESLTGTVTDGEQNVY